MGKVDRGNVLLVWLLQELLNQLVYGIKIDRDSVLGAIWAHDCGCNPIRVALSLPLPLGAFLLLDLAVNLPLHALQPRLESALWVHKRINLQSVLGHALGP